MTDRKIAFIGDSVTAAANVALSQRWPHMVGVAAGYLDGNIVNAGVPGDKSAQMRARFTADAMIHNPAVIGFMMGVNDAANGISLSTHEANYRSMIEEAKAGGAKVAIITPPIYRQNVAGWRTWHAKWLELATVYECPLVDISRAYGWEYVADSSVFNALYVNSTDLVHQSAAGNSRIAAICCEPQHIGAFRPDVPQPADPVCSCQPGQTDELSLALVDLQLYGATPARLSRLASAMANQLEEV